MAFHYAGFADEASKSLSEQIAATKKVGWDAIEVRLCADKNFCDLSDEEFRSACEQLQSEGIRIAGFGSQIANWSRSIDKNLQDDIDELKRSVPRMHETGAKVIRCMSYPNSKPPLPRDEWKEEVFRRMSELAKIAEDGGVVLGHENCSGYGGEGPEESLELLERVDNDAFKLIFDTGNQPHNGDMNLWDFYDRVKDHVVHVHVKATREADGIRKVCYPDEDSDDAPRRILQDLKRRDYDGWVSIEPHLAAQVHAGKDVEDVQAATEIYVEYGRRLMKIVDELE